MPYVGDGWGSGWVGSMLAFQNTDAQGVCWSPLALYAVYQNMYMIVAHFYQLHQSFTTHKGVEYKTLQGACSAPNATVASCGSLA